MKYTQKTVTRPNEILFNDNYVAIPYDCSDIAANEDGIVPAGTIIPANNATAIGVLLSDVKKDENPNGTIVIHGFIKKAKLPVEPDSDAVTALKGVVFMPLVVIESNGEEESGEEESGEEESNGEEEPNPV